MATQSERLGFEFAKWLGVQTPQARVIHNCSSEWLQIKEAAERARATSTSEGDKIGEITCSELLEALDLSRCLLLMSYIHGSPLLESSNAFKRETAEKTAAALGRVLLLDLVIRNEDRLSCRQLGWRGNPDNLLLADKMITANDSILSQLLNFQIVAIDSGVPRRPPSGKRTNDHANYPKLVELLLNNYGYSSNLLYDITGGRLGSPPLEDANINGVRGTEITSVVHHFRNGFRAALRDLQSFHIFLLTLHQKLDNLLRAFMNISSKTSGDSDKEDIMVPDTALHGGLHCPSPPGKDQFLNDNHPDFSDSELPRTVPRSSSSGNKESSDSRSPMSKECWSGKLSKAGDIHLMTTKLRHIHKCAKVDTESNKKLEQWNEMLRTDAIKLCQDNNFMTGFFEGTDTNYVVDAYELKIRLEHILERISLISDAADTEKPSPLTNYLSIGGCISRCGPLLNGFSSSRSSRLPRVCLP